MDDLKERPILFSGAMVRAILSGQKTVTRRVVHWRGEGEALVMPSRDGQPQWPYARRNGNETPLRCPYGAPGDRLWVRETFALMLPKDPRTGEPTGFTATKERPDGIVQHVAYAADAPDFEWCDGDGFALEGRSCWRPSIHMPRWASRLTLAVADVRVERLHAIDDADALREGVATVGTRPELGPRGEFRALWDMINSKRAPWASNPWVWRVQFKRIEDGRG